MSWEERAHGETFLKVGRRAGQQGRFQAYRIHQDSVKCQDQAMAPGFVSPRTWDRRGNSQKENETFSLRSSQAPVGIPSGQVSRASRILYHGSAPQGPSQLVYPSQVPREAHFVECMVTDGEFVLRGQ